LFYELPSDYATNAIRSYYFSFVHHLDPNVDSGYADWPQWGTAKEKVNFNASNSGNIVDDFRQEQYEFLEKHESS
jgi:triacylglycerol lipase